MLRGRLEKAKATQEEEELCINTDFLFMNIFLFPTTFTPFPNKLNNQEMRRKVKRALTPYLFFLKERIN